MNLTEIRKLCDEATPGPWEVEHHLGMGMRPAAVGVKSQSHQPPPYDWMASLCIRDIKEYDARFIATSRTLLPKLVDLAYAVADHHECLADALVCPICDALAALEAE